jgi:transcriptional regulator with XRE-family HTH domain
MDLDLSKKIKLLRAERGMTLEQVAQIVGVGKSTVRKWETGTIANMRRDKIDKLATALGTSPAYLMGWNKTIPTDEPKLTDGEKALIDLFRQIPENKQSVVLEMIRLALKTQE